jgi:peptidyl-dipeptidase Dcp
MGGAAAIAMLTAIPAAAQSAASTTASVSGNILLQDWKGPYDGVPPWDQVKVSDFPEAFQLSMDEYLREIDAIANNQAAPTFANTIEAMERSGERLDRVQSIFGVYSSNLATPEVQALNKEWSPKLSATYDKVNLNGALFARIADLYARKDSLGLDA